MFKRQFSWPKLAMSALAFFVSVNAFAKEINLYEQPKADSKVSATIDPANGIIPIYTPKEGGWVKVADPKNGNVGWAKSAELNNLAASQTTFSVTQTLTSDNKAPTTYRIIQFGQPSHLTAEQAQMLVKQMQQQQAAMHQSMQAMMQNMDKLFYDNWHFLQDEHFPFIMPVMVVPVQKATGAAQAAPHAKNK